MILLENVYASLSSCFNQCPFINKNTEFIEIINKFEILYFIFQVFGLGNKTYEHYNEVAIYIDKRLEELGATRVYQLGLGDDDAK